MSPLPCIKALCWAHQSSAGLCDTSAGVTPLSPHLPFPARGQSSPRVPAAASRARSPQCKHSCSICKNCTPQQVLPCPVRGVQDESLQGWPGRWELGSPAPPAEDLPGGSCTGTTVEERGSEHCHATTSPVPSSPCSCSHHWGGKCLLFPIQPGNLPGPFSNKLVEGRAPLCPPKPFPSSACIQPVSDRCLKPPAMAPRAGTCTTSLICCHGIRVTPCVLQRAPHHLVTAKKGDIMNRML